jgi:hypothetical protein
MSEPPKCEEEAATEAALLKRGQHVSCAVFQRVRCPALGNIHSLRPGEVFARSSRKALGFFWIASGKGHPRQNLGLLAMIPGTRHTKCPFT